MPNYQYSARNWGGDVQSGTIFAETDNQLQELLRQRGLFLTKFAKSEDQLGKARPWFLQAHSVKLVDLVVLSRQLATLVRAGLPVVEALGTVVAQTENPIVAEAVNNVRLDIVAGSSLSAAMRQHPKVFNSLFISLVEAGEVGGVLDHTLEVAADQFDKEAVLREKVRSAMTYPKVVVVACVLVVAFMITVIVPAFAKVYSDFGHELPWITRFLLSVSDFTLRFGWGIVLGIAAMAFAYLKYVSTAKGRRVRDRMILNIPLTGKVMRKVAIARFAETWAGSTKGGIPILEALLISAQTAGNTVIQDSVVGILDKVQAGSPVSPSLDRTGEFPPLVTRMIAAGEKSGNLDFMLEELSKYYKRDVDFSVERLTKLMEPAMTLMVGGIVLFVLMALYMPIFTLPTVIKR